jgi:hypothetical protein
MVACGFLGIASFEGECGVCVSYSTSKVGGFRGSYRKRNHDEVK